jgi:hypothetical protein
VSIDPQALDSLSRDALIAQARELGVRRPELMTRVELKDEIVRLSESDASRRRLARGWLGVARDLIASLVEQGLNMPDAAALIRGEAFLAQNRVELPVATVTLAEIYAAQGHVTRALGMVEEVLEKEPDHQVASALRARLVEQFADRPSSLPPEPAALAPEPPAAVPSVAPEPTQAPPGEPHRDDAVDGVVTIARAPGAVYVYWECAEATLRRAKKRDPSGCAVVVLVALRPSWDGAQREERELGAEPARGGALVDGLAEGAVVRAAIGWRSPSGFVPFAVGSSLLAGDGRDSHALSDAQSRALAGFRALG